MHYRKFSRADLTRADPGTLIGGRGGRQELVIRGSLFATLDGFMDEL
jgi:hypothetical protein